MSDLPHLLEGNRRFTERFAYGELPRNAGRPRPHARAVPAPSIDSEIGTLACGRMCNSLPKLRMRNEYTAFQRGVGARKRG